MAALGLATEWAIEVVSLLSRVHLLDGRSIRQLPYFTAPPCFHSTHSPIDIFFFLQLTPKFVSFFLVALIVVNVSETSVPIELSGSYVSADQPANIIPSDATLTCVFRSTESVTAFPSGTSLRRSAASSLTPRTCSAATPASSLAGLASPSLLSP
jgi:hypothetical protein